MKRPEAHLETISLVGECSPIDTGAANFHLGQSVLGSDIIRLAGRCCVLLLNEYRGAEERVGSIGIDEWCRIRNIWNTL